MTDQIPQIIKGSTQGSIKRIRKIHSATNQEQPLPQEVARTSYSHRNFDLNHMDHPIRVLASLSFLDIRQNLSLASQCFSLSDWHKSIQLVHSRLFLNSGFLRVVLVAMVGVLEGTLTVLFNHAGAVFLFDVGVFVSPSRWSSKATLAILNAKVALFAKENHLLGMHGAFERLPCSTVRVPSLGEMFSGDDVVGGRDLATTLFHAVVVDFGDVGAWVGESDITLAKVRQNRISSVLDEDTKYLLSLTFALEVAQSAVSLRVPLVNSLDFWGTGRDQTALLLHALFVALFSLEIQAEALPMSA